MLRLVLLTLVALLLPVTPSFALSTGEPVANLTIPTQEGGSVDITALHGKVVYLDFWASWCIPCRQSFPFMNQLHQKYGAQGLEIVAVNRDNVGAVIRAFLARHHPTFTIGLDPEGTLANQLGVSSLPTSFLIDRAGRVRHIHVGFELTKAGDVEEEIKALLAK